MSLLFQLLAVAGLLLLNAFFVAAEYGLVTARRTRITELRDQGNQRARLVLRITANPPRFIAAMQLGVTITSLAIGALGEPVFAHIFEPIPATLVSFALAFLVITYLHVVIGELVPKGIALGHAESTALFVSRPVSWFFVLMRPLIWVLEHSTDGVLRVLGLESPGEERSALSEAELKMLLDRSTQSGELEQQEQEMLYKVFDFADKEVSEVMVPRPDVVALSIELPPEQALAAVIDSPYTRYPVYRETLDNVVGILHVRDLFSALVDRGIANVVIEEIVRDAYIVPETKDLAAMLTEFRRTNQHMAIVVDEYGAMQGIVTLEDLLEEIVGEIEDEFDLPDESIERIDDDTIRIAGTFPIDDFNEQFGTRLTGEDYHTVGGFVFGLLGRAPGTGDSLDFDGMRFDVLEVEGSRILKLAVTFMERSDRKEPVAEGEGEGQTLAPYSAAWHRPPSPTTAHRLSGRVPAASLDPIDCGRTWRRWTASVQRSRRGWGSWGFTPSATCSITDRSGTRRPRRKCGSPTCSRPRTRLRSAARSSGLRCAAPGAGSRSSRRASPTRAARSPRSGSTRSGSPTSSRPGRASACAASCAGTSSPFARTT